MKVLLSLIWFVRKKAWDFKSKSFVDLDGFKLPNGAIFDVDKHCTFPIPLREIQINPDLK